MPGELPMMPKRAPCPPDAAVASAPRSSRVLSALATIWRRKALFAGPLHGLEAQLFQALIGHPGAFGGSFAGGAQLSHHPDDQPADQHGAAEAHRIAIADQEEEGGSAGQRHQRRRPGTGNRRGRQYPDHHGGEGIAVAEHPVEGQAGSTLASATAKPIR